MPLTSSVSQFERKSLLRANKKNFTDVRKETFLNDICQHLKDMHRWLWSTAVSLSGRYTGSFERTQGLWTNLWHIRPKIIITSVDSCLSTCWLFLHTIKSLWIFSVISDSL